MATIRRTLLDDSAVTIIEEARQDAERYAVETTSFTDNDGSTVQKGAKGFALDAESARDVAQTARDDAQSARDTAQSAASNAATSASTASSAATDAESARDAAQTAESGAQSAEADAESARDTAQTARDGAQLAESGASSAQAAAESARDDAQAEATAASGHADDAQQAATDAQESADDALASSSFVAIVDTEADLSSISNPSSGDQALVRDDTANGNGTQAIYEYDGSSWSFIGHSLVSEGQRNSPDGFAGIDSDGYVEHRRTLYIDSRQGSDSADGKSKTTPLQTISAAITQVQNEGIEQVRLKRGSVFRGDFLSLANEVEFIGSYGEGTLPVVTGDEVIDKANVSAVTAPNGTTIYKFTSSSQKQKDYSSGVGLQHPESKGGLDGSDVKLFFEDGEALNPVEQLGDYSTEGEYLDEVANNPGHFYIPGDNEPDPARADDLITDAVYYFHPSDGSDPTQNAKQYAYGYRQRGARTLDTVFEDIVWMRHTHRYPVDLTYTVCRNCHTVQHGMHSFMARSAYLEGCSADCTDMGFSGFHGFHDESHYDERGALGLYFKNCIAEGDHTTPSGGGGGNAFWSHGGGNPPTRPYVIMDGCRGFGFGSFIGFSDAENILVYDSFGTGKIGGNTDLFKNSAAVYQGGGADRSNFLPKRSENSTIFVLADGRSYQQRINGVTAELEHCALIADEPHSGWSSDESADITLRDCLVGNIPTGDADFTLEGQNREYLPGAGNLYGVDATAECPEAAIITELITNFDPADSVYLFDDSGTAPNGQSYNAVLRVNYAGSGSAGILLDMSTVYISDIDGGGTGWYSEVVDNEASGYDGSGDLTFYLQRDTGSTTYDGTTDIGGMAYFAAIPCGFSRDKAFEVWFNGPKDKIRLPYTSLSPDKARQWFANGQPLHIEGHGSVLTASLPYDDGNPGLVIDLDREYTRFDTQRFTAWNSNFDGAGGGQTYPVSYTMRTNLPLVFPSPGTEYPTGSPLSYEGVPVGPFSSYGSGTLTNENAIGLTTGRDDFTNQHLSGVVEQGNIAYHEQTNQFAFAIPAQFDCSDPQNPATISYTVRWRSYVPGELPDLIGDPSRGEQAYQAVGSIFEDVGPQKTDPTPGAAKAARTRVVTQ